MHSFRRKIRGKNGFAGLKIYISKAYNRLEWSYLRAVLVKMGFDLRWVNLILFSISIVSYRILSQGSYFGSIVSEKDIRQGDLISLYLFILCTEGLSRMIQSRANRGLLHMCKIAPSVPQVSHMFFADDSIMFFNAKINEAKVIQIILMDYASASEWVINISKSLVCFSGNAKVEVYQSICFLLQVIKQPNLGHYLGFPTGVDRNKWRCWVLLKRSFVQD